MLKLQDGSKNEKRKYFVRETFMLRVCGVSTTGNESIVYRTYSYFVLIVLNCMYPVVAVGDLFKQDMDVVAEIGVYFAGSWMVILGTAAILRKRLKLGNLLAKMEAEPFLPNLKRGGREEEKLINSWLTFTNIQGLVTYSGATGSVAYLTFSSLYKRIRSDDYHDWVFSFGPITLLNVTYSPNFEITWTYQNITVFCLVWSMCSTTLIAAGSLAFIGTQYRLLQASVRRIVERSYHDMIRDNGGVDNQGLKIPKEIDTSAIPWKYLKANVKDIVTYHLKIIDFSKEWEEIFNIAIFWIYITSMTQLCFEIYRSTSLPFGDPRMPRLLIEAASISLLSLLIGYCAEQTAEECMAVGRAAYETNFVGTDVRFQKSLVMIIARSQYPMKLKAANIIDISLSTFVWILRTAYSVFAMLRNTRLNSKNP